MLNLSLCYIMSFILMFFDLLIVTGMILRLKEQVYMIEYESITMNSAEVVMTLLLDWMSTLFAGFILFNFSMIMLYSEDYMYMYMWW